jgi:hypothetical protein
VRLPFRQSVPRPGVCHVGQFNKAKKLSASCEVMGLEGIVSTKADQRRVEQ